MNTDKITKAIKEITLCECEGCSGLFCKECKFWYALEALRKQIKKKPIQKKLVCDVGTCYERTDTFYVCPCCGNRVEVDDNEGYLTEYYPACECGQRIDWEGIVDGYDMKWNENWSDNE